MTSETLRRVLVVGAAAGLPLVIAARGASAQQGAGGGKHRPQPIEIRGQVPTPQVVTVRPRQVPTFSHDVLTPAFFDHHFWGALFAPIEIAPNLSPEAGATAVSVMPAAPLPADSSHRPPPADSTTRAIVTPVAPTSAPAPAPFVRPSAGDSARARPSNAPREK